MKTVNIPRRRELTWEQRQEAWEIALKLLHACNEAVTALGKHEREYQTMCHTPFGWEQDPKNPDDERVELFIAQAGEFIGDEVEGFLCYGTHWEEVE